MKLKKASKKILVVFLALCLIKTLYYFVMVRPTQDLWDYTIQIMSGEVPPNRKDILHRHFNLPMHYPTTEKIEYKAKRLFVWHGSKKGIIIMSYKQVCYDASGKWLYGHADSAMVLWIKKVDGEWIVTARSGSA